VDESQFLVLVLAKKVQIEMEKGKWYHMRSSMSLGFAVFATLFLSVEAEALPNSSSWSKQNFKVESDYEKILCGASRLSLCVRMPISGFVGRLSGL